MAILSADNFNVVIGQITSSFIPSLNNQTIEIAALDLIKVDLAPYFSNPLLRNFTIGWRLGLYAEIENPRSTYRSALPKYDLGTVCFTNSGALVHEARWNYQSQFFPSYVTQYTYDSLSYPLLPEFCADIDPNPVYITSINPLGCADLADSAYIGLNGDTVPNNCFTFILYQALGATNDFQTVQQAIVFSPE